MNFSSNDFLLIPALDKKMKKRFNFKDLPSARELEQRTILMFVNTDNAVDQPEPLQPNMIQVGGLQIVDPKPLPDVT